MPRRRGWQIALLPCAVLLLPLVLLVTCGPAVESEILATAAAPPPIADASGAARFSGAEFITGDGARLPLRRWLPAGRVKAVIVALHGFNDYSKAFEQPAMNLAARGIATYAYDQRGFGGAPDRGSWAGEGRLAVDAVTATRILRRMYPGRPIYLLGESMGGAIAILAATGAMRGVTTGPEGAPKAEIDGVILSAPAVWSRPTMDLWPKVALFIGARLLPKTVLTGRGLSVVASDNIPMLRALGRDPMVLKGARIDTIFGLVDAMDDALDAAPRATMPLLLLYGARDQLVPPAAMAAFVERLPAEPSARATLAYYPNGYHMLLRDLDGPLVAADVASWIADRRKRLPSRADAADATRPWPPQLAPSAARPGKPLAEAGVRR